MKTLALALLLLTSCAAPPLDEAFMPPPEDTGTDAARAEASTDSAALDTAVDASDAAPPIDTAPTCTPKPIAEACRMPDGFAEKGYVSCGVVNDGCGGKVECTACAGVCGRGWSGPGAPEAGMCVCADGYDDRVMCLTKSLKPGRYFRCFKISDWSYGGSGEDCRDSTLPGDPWKSLCCP